MYTGIKTNGSAHDYASAQRVLEQAALTTTEGLKPGDVLKVSRRLRDMRTGDPFWWTSFRVVLKVRRRSLRVLTLKLHPDPDKDEWDIEFDEETVVTYLPESQWPQGVSAMWMKLVQTGAIKIGED